MTKLSEELKADKDEELVDQILTHVSHIDLKNEYKALVKEIADVSSVIAAVKEPVKKAVKKAAKKTVIKVVKIDE